MTRYTIIGLGVAGTTAAEEIRKRDPKGEITILNGERRPFYFRPALSWLLKGKITEPQILARPADWAQVNGFNIISENAVVIKPDEKVVISESGGRIVFDRLLIATGAQAITPPWSGVSLNGVFTYRTLGDALSIADGVKLSQNKKAVVIGGGILGVEMAEILSRLGLSVTLIAREDRVLSLLFDDTASSIVQRGMVSEGVKVVTLSTVKSIIGSNGRVMDVELETGEKLGCDIVAIAVGVRSQTEFLQGSGLTQNGQLVVSDGLATQEDGIYAAGDAIARKTGSGLVPCRTWLDAAEQGKTAGANMTGAGLVYNNDQAFFNASHVFGRFYAVIGRFNAPDDEAITSQVFWGRDGAYMKIVTENGRVIGGTCLDDIRSALAVRRATLEQRSLQEFGCSIPAMLDSVMPYALF
jgi:NAD(P)H-nitrite reductase large subunit